MDFKVFELRNYKKLAYKILRELYIKMSSTLNYRLVSYLMTNLEKNKLNKA